MADRMPEPPHGIKTLLALHGISWKDVEELTIDWHIDRGLAVKVRHKPANISVNIEFKVPDENMKVIKPPADGLPGCTTCGGGKCITPNTCRTLRRLYSVDGGSH